MPRRRNLTTAIDHLSPKAKIIADRQVIFGVALMPRGQLISLTCPRAGQAVDFVDLPSCRAGTYFRYAAKVSKDALRGRGKPFGAVSLSPLKSPLLSTARGPPPSLKRRGLTDTITQRSSRDLEIYAPTSRESTSCHRKRKTPHAEAPWAYRYDSAK